MTRLYGDKKADRETEFEHFMLYGVAVNLLFEKKFFLKGKQNAMRWFLLHPGLLKKKEEIKTLQYTVLLGSTLSTFTKETYFQAKQ